MGIPNTSAQVPIGTAVVAAINSVLALVVSFGFPLTAIEQTEIVTTTNSIVILFVALSHAYRSQKAAHFLQAEANGISARQDPADASKAVDPPEVRKEVTDTQKTIS